MIETSLCNICGTVVMKSFFHEHMTYVHGSRTDGLKRSKSSKDNQPEKRSHAQKIATSEKNKKQVSNRKIPTPKEIIKDPRFESAPVKCILCGQSIKSGQMLAHKQSVHGEKPYSSSTVGRSPSNQWVRVFQGGLPGLGKRHS